MTFVVNSSEPSPISTKFFAITLPSAMLGRVMVYRASVPEMMENKIATISEMMVIVLFMNYYLLNYYYLLLSIIYVYITPESNYITGLKRADMFINTFE